MPKESVEVIVRTEGHVAPAYPASRLRGQVAALLKRKALAWVAEVRVPAVGEPVLAVLRADQDWHEGVVVEASADGRVQRGRPRREQGAGGAATRFDKHHTL